MKKFKDSLHLFSPKNKRFRDSTRSEAGENSIYEIGNDIEETFGEDVENVKFNADDLSYFFTKSGELEDGVEEETEETISNAGEATAGEVAEKHSERSSGGGKTVGRYKKIKMLFDPAVCGPYICCVVIIKKEENIEIEFIYPNIIDKTEVDNFLKKRKKKNRVKTITPFNVWYRYERDWVEDVKTLIFERIYLFKEINMSNVLCDFYNYKTGNIDTEYNIMYGLSGNRYYIIAMDYLEDHMCKEIVVISQVPYFDFICSQFHENMQRFVATRTTQVRNQVGSEIRGEIETYNGGEGHEIIAQFVDNLSGSEAFEKLTYKSLYATVIDEVAQVNNLKVKNILVFLKGILLEKKIALVCSKKGNGCRILLLFLSFIPDVINLGFNTKNYEEKFDEWLRLKLPLILFHEKYILLLHVNNLQLFNEYTFEKNYLICTNTDSDVHNFVKNDVDILYYTDQDDLVIKKKNLTSALTLTKYENSYLKKMHSFFKSFFVNFSSLFFENTKLKEDNVRNNAQPLACLSPSVSKYSSGVLGDTSGGDTNEDEKRQVSPSEGVFNSGKDEKTSQGTISNKGEIYREDKSGGEDERGEKSNTILPKITGTSGIDCGNVVVGCSLIGGGMDEVVDCNEYIDDEDDVCIINIKSVNMQQKKCILPVENGDDLPSNETKCGKEKKKEYEQVEEKYIADLRNHFHVYFKNFFLLSKENYEDGVKEIREEYEVNYNHLFLEMWQETKNYSFFIEKDFKMNKFLKIAEQNNVLFDKKGMKNYIFVDDLLIIEKKEKEIDIKKEKINTYVKEVLLISLEGYTYEGSYCMLKNCKQGIGKYMYNIYDIIFHGEWENNNMNGSGHLLCNNKFKYFGKFKNNLFHGNGLYVDYSLNQYEGEFLNGYFNGNGKLIFNKNTYMGIFKNNNLIGKGKILYENGFIYTGQIKNFLPHGYGFWSYNNTITFEGYFVEGKKNGHGILTINCNSRSDETFYIEGKWKNDNPVLRKKFNVIFPNKDKYIGKMYILSSNQERDNNTCHNLCTDNTLAKRVNKELTAVKKLIENQIGAANQDMHSRESVTLESNNLETFTKNESTATTLPTRIHYDNAEEETKKVTNIMSLVTTEDVTSTASYHIKSANTHLENVKMVEKNILREKFEIVIKTKEKKLLRKCFDILDKSWIYNTENKMKKNKDVVQYLKQKNLFLIPHKKGLSIIYSKKKENYDGKFCLGMKHGYGISVYGNVNRYEGYWYRGMKHGYGILYEGDNIYYAHFNYDKLIQKEKILPEQVPNYKPTKGQVTAKHRVKNFLINQSFFDYGNFLSSTLRRYL
ncbi:MORN repeat protein, putative [Plasmodium ovale]|uniref:MORN repeat protein, putative n=1 Tax=Plasmodium ovale TaxID=36330 RepID=A0A1C3KHV4_PLAOA|nr:MORN repeat protein, putative [Plasmodium ovale]